MKKFITHSRSGFTLVELMIALTIFAIMSTMTILIYFHVSEGSRRLQISREISETARQITERISAEINTYGISSDLYEASTFEQDVKNGDSVALSLNKDNS